MKQFFGSLTVVSVGLALTACNTSSKSSDSASMENVPAAVAVPAGHKPAMTLVGAGDLTYECRMKADKSGHEWAFVGPNATLADTNKNVIGKYYAGPTWELTDGSKITGKQLAVSPNPNAIPLQLVQTTPATGAGALNGVTYIQRLNTQGGSAPSDACGTKNTGEKKTVKYQADYVFSKPM